jgi:hypothetical protein
VNARILHVYVFAWEVAVIRFQVEGPESEFDLDYSTELTNDVETFGTDEETNAFIVRARDYFIARMIRDMKRGEDSD